MTRSFRGLSRRAIEVERRRQKVAAFMAQRLTVSEMREMLIKRDKNGMPVDAAGKLIIDPAAQPYVYLASQRTLEGDVAAIREQMSREIGSLTPRDMAVTIRRDTEVRHRQLMQMYAETSSLVGRDSRHKYTARIAILKELRALEVHIVEIYQSLGIVYKRPVEVDIRERVLAQISTVPKANLARIVAATTEAEYRSAMTEAFGADAAGTFLLPSGEVPASGEVTAP